MKVIFLDIDGVLVHSNYKNQETKNIDESKIKLLKKIIEETSAKIVLTSNWRTPYIENGKIYRQPEYYTLSSLLKKYGIDIYDQTPLHKLKFLQTEDLQKLDKPIKSRFDPITTRAGEIFTYLETNKEIQSFIIIDDEDSEWEYFDLDKNLIKTNYHDKGLKEEHIRQIIEILGKSNTKTR